MRKTKILALCTMLLLLALVAGCGSSPNLGVKENKADLAITIVDGNGAAVSDAVVSVDNDANLTVTTDASGKCTIKNVTLGSRTVRASKIGYDFLSQAVTVVDGDNNQRLTMAYNGGGQVRVTVQDAVGKSIGKAAVSVINSTTHQVIASTITGFDGVAALNVAVGTYQVKVAIEDYKMLTVDGVAVTAGKATEMPAVVRSDVHQGHIAITGVALTDAGVFNGPLAGVAARVVEANKGGETTSTGSTTIDVPAGTYVVGIALPTSQYERPTVAGGDALATTSITHYLPGAASGETIYRLVTVPADGTVTITVQMYRRPDVPVNTSKVASYEVFTFTGCTANQTVYLRGSFSDWAGKPRIPLAEIALPGGALQRGTGNYRFVGLFDMDAASPDWAQNQISHATNAFAGPYTYTHTFKLADDGYTTGTNTAVTVEAGDVVIEGSTDGNGNGARPLGSTLTGHGAQAFHFETTAPHGATVEARGSFNNWGGYSLVNPPIQLVETSDGKFEKTVYFPTGSYQFKYVINGNWEANRSTGSTNREFTVTADAITNVHE